MVDRQERVQLRSDRLKLRMLDRMDAAFVESLYADPRVTEPLLRIQGPNSLEEAREFCQAPVAKCGEYRFGAARRIDGNLIALGSVRSHAELPGVASIGYSVLPAYWNQGVATELAALLLAFVSDSLGAPEVRATTLDGNRASERVLEKLGFSVRERGAEVDSRGDHRRVTRWFLRCPTRHPEVNSVLAEVLAKARRILGDQFVGMYLDGSLAMGGFDPDKSDLDFVVVTETDVSAESFIALEAMHVRVAGGASKWSRELEGSYISRHALRHDRRPGAHPQIERGGSLTLEQPESGYWPIHRHVLREHGVALAGPSPRTLIDPVGPEELREAVRGILREWWKPMLVDGPRLRNGFYRCYAVLTMSRMLYTICHGSIATKPATARWAQEALPNRWTPLIQRALAWSGEEPPGLEETLAYIQYTCHRENSSSSGMRDVG